MEGAPRRRRSRERRPQRQWLPPTPPPAVPGGRPASPAPSLLNGRTRPPLLPAPPPLLRSRQGACAASPAAAAPRPGSAQARRARWRRRGAGQAVPRCSRCPGGIGGHGKRQENEPRELSCHPRVIPPPAGTEPVRPHSLLKNNKKICHNWNDELCSLQFSCNAVVRENSVVRVSLLRVLFW